MAHSKKKKKEGGGREKKLEEKKHGGWPPCSTLCNGTIYRIEWHTPHVEDQPGAAGKVFMSWRMGLKHGSGGLTTEGPNNMIK